MIDFHCHLDLFKSPQAAAEVVEGAGLYLLSVTNTPKAFPKTAQIAKGRKRIQTALGLHPQLVHERHDEVSLFIRLIDETQYVGEIGIDGGNEYATHMDLQVEVFERLLRECTARGGKVISIHSRHASGEVIESLRKYPAAGVPVLHWFTGSIRQAEHAVSLGAWFSVGLPMTKSKRTAEIIEQLPRDRVLTETDAPFVSTPDNAYPVTAVLDAERMLARIWKCEVEEVRAQLKRNLATVAQRGKAFRKPMLNRATEATR